MLTIAKTKIGIASLVLASFIVGGIAFNAYQVGAFDMWGFFGGGCDLSGLEKGAPEWQAKADKCNADREVKQEERKTQMEEFKSMTPEERQVKIEGLKANWPENMPFKGRGHMFGRMFGLKGLSEADYQVQNLSDGVQIAITSDDTDTVVKLQEWAAQIPVAN